MVQKKQNNMMPKTLYRYSQEQRKQKPEDILATDSGFQSNEVYLTFVQNLMKKGKKSTAENLFRKTLQILKQKTKNSENVFVVLEKAVKNVEPSFFLKKPVWEVLLNRFLRLWIKKRKNRHLFVLLFKSLPKSRKKCTA